MAVSIASILTRICARVGITDIDVTDLEDRYVEGYVIPRVMTAANAIEPLRQVGFFDIVESGTTLKFVARGKPAVRTLTDDDLGAHDGTSDDGKGPPAVITRKMQDVELPRQIRVHFRNPERDYEDDEQLSPTRVTTDAVNDVDLEIAVAMTSEQASQVAEILWADPWAGRWLHQTAVDHSHLDLEPGDCIHLPVDGRLERVRILSIDDAGGLVRKLETARDDDGGYSSSAFADAVERTTTTLSAISETELFFLDLPALRTDDTDAGFYIAARESLSSTGNRWRGATIYRSTDAGGSAFELLLTVSNEATTGVLVNALPTGDLPLGSPVDWDDANTITVTLESGTLESRTENEVLAGANHIALGAHDRWEIIGFTTATQISETQWELTHLLRGRRGTEYVMGTSQAADVFVLVSGAGVIRAPLTSAQIDSSYIYKAVSIGAAFNDGDDFTFVGSGRSLQPFAPTNVTLARQANGDILISWTGRDRMGQELTYYVDSESDPPTTYSIDIRNTGSPTTIVRTLSSSTTSVTYTTAQQNTDHGSPTPTSLTVTVYKVSPTVGRGIGATATGSIL